jgi:TatD DNase family protein
MSSFFIDTHCHLDLFKDIQKNTEFENNLGIKTVSVTNAPSFYPPNDKLFANLENIRVALGLHPQLISQYQSEITLFEKLIPETKYIGEIGLDGSADLKASFSIQREIFEKILRAVKYHDNKILTIHSRNAAKETIGLLSKYLFDSKCKIILHWFSGSTVELKTAIAKNFYFSINHKMANSEKGKKIIKTIPDHLLLTETDAPFTFSGGIQTRLESLDSTITSIASQKNKNFDEIKHGIFKNFKMILS